MDTFAGARTTSAVAVLVGMTAAVVGEVAELVGIELLEGEPEPPPELGDDGLVAVKVVERAVGLEITV